LIDLIKDLDMPQVVSISYVPEFGLAVLLLLFLRLGKLFRDVIDHRRLVSKFPGPKGHSMIWGHAKLLGEVVPEP
jgi:hypothetical protein